MSPRRRRPPVDYGHCQRCGARIHWTPRATRQHRGPLDPTQPVYLDLDGEPAMVAYECGSGLEIRGAEVTDLAAHEQRDADERRTPAPGEGARRIIRCYRLHACDPRDMAAAQAEPARPIQGGADRAAGEHLE